MQKQGQARKTVDRDALRRSPSSNLSKEGQRTIGRAESSSVTPLPDVCREIAKKTPKILSGNDRLNYHISQLSKLESRELTAMGVHVDHLLRRMTKIGASDIDLGGMAGQGYVWYRVNGDKKPDYEVPKYSEDESNLLILNLLSEGARKNLIEERAADFSYELPEKRRQTPHRFRATAYMDSDFVALNMRAISETVRPLQSLNFHPSIERGLMFTHVRDGLTLITGVTGSGKSTTLDAIIDANNDSVYGHIVIIGNPIEYLHKSRKCIVRHREVGRDVATFKDGIVQSLRQDPDIVVIGEMRDPKTISAALEITDSGHKVFSTLHTSSAIESIDRIVAEYPPEEQTRVRFRLADVLRCIVSQKLCPKVGGGRILVKEVMWMTSSARAAIKNNNTNEIYQMMWEGWSSGQITLEQDLFRLERRGLITPETALNYANNKLRYAQLSK